MWSLDRPEGDYEGLSTSTRSIDQSIPWKKNRTIPESGIRVFVIGEDNKVEKRDVALGLKTAQSVTILSGISAGDRLAGDNLDKLHDGNRVKILDQQ